MSWLKWFFWTSRRCKHQASHWEMRDMGMGEVRWCDDCGKCLELV